MKVRKPLTYESEKRQEVLNFAQRVQISDIWLGLPATFPVPNSMKKLITLVVLLAAVGANAQSFEGTIRWTMSMEITDPAMKAKMAEAEQQMKDPEMQAKMKELEAQMNDPEMKKMMEQNPQVKAAMENAMKMASGGAQANMNSMMPKGMTIKMKGTNVATLMEGGMVDGTEILHKDGQPTIRVNRKDMTYSSMPERKPGGPEPEINVTKGNDTKKILGYECQKYVVDMKAEGQNVKQVMWTTTEIKDIDVKALARQRNAQGQPMFSDKINGFPLRIEVGMQQGNMVMEVAEIKRGSISDADFNVPSGFKEVKSPY